MKNRNLLFRTDLGEQLIMVGQQHSDDDFQWHWRMGLHHDDLDGMGGCGSSGSSDPDGV